MLQINSVTSIDQKNHIAILDTSSVSFMQEVRAKGANVDKILKDYDLILIPNWVLTEIKDSSISADYIQDLIDKGYPIFSIEEELYSSLAGNEEGNLFHIVCASANQLAQVKSYLRKYVEKGAPLDMDAYAEWIKRLYDEWPIAGPVLSSGRRKKKNAGEVSITILAEVISWYYPQSEAVTIYSQDRDTLEFQRSAEEQLRRVFASRTPVPISYKSNDAILCQLCRLGIISIDQIGEFRKNERKITYGGWFLDQHVQEPDVRYNILYGHYDYVVLQEHAHPFGPVDRFYEAVRKLNEWIRQANAIPVIYMTWAREDEEFMQDTMTEAHEFIAKEVNALIAPVGKYWWSYKRSWPQLTMYAEDGAHASASGSDFAAKYIWDAITDDIHLKKLSNMKTIIEKNK